MHSVNEMAWEIIRREGGYVNDPDDPGGATNRGVTIHTMRRLGLDLDGDGDVDAQDVKLITAEQAHKIFVDEYFHGPNISQLPRALHATVFDMQVNAGSGAIKILQGLYNDFVPHIKGIDKITVDGGIGENTIKAINTIADVVPADVLVNAYGIARREYYFRIADRRPASRKYFKRRNGGKAGWVKRAEEFISERFHWSAAQFDERTAAWG